jgi:hypothetical protein
MLMERVAEIIRGWPYDGSLERSELITTGSTLVNGDWVTKQADGTVDKVGATAVGLVGLVIVGNGDSASAANAGEAVVLWSISNYDGTKTYAPGAALTVKNGVITTAAATVVTGSAPVTSVVLGDPIVGYVLDVVASASGANPQTAHLTIVKA